MNKPDLKHIDPNHTYLLAVSGGMDSMVMLHLFRQANLRVNVAHMNYQLRGEDSDLDEELVRLTCEQFSIPFYSMRVNLKSEAETKGSSIQLKAREIRYHFFHNLLEEHGLDMIATAHHADDHIETMLFHFFRGTGLEGLTGIPVRNERIIRPMLHWTKQRIIHFVHEHQIPYREDISNASNDYTRNKLRLDIIPKLEEIFPALKENLLGNISRMEQSLIVYKGAIEGYRKKLVERRGKDDYIPILKLEKIHPQETILYEILKPYGFGFEQCIQVLKLLHSQSGHWVENESYRVIRHRIFLIITERKEKESGFILIEEETREVITSDFMLHIHKEKSTETSISKRADTCTVPLMKLEFPLILRKWKQGDYLYPFGMNKKKKVSRVLIDAKIPLHEKEHVWVLESGKKIVWVVGLKTDHRYRVEKPTEKWVFRLSDLRCNNS